MSFFNRSCKTPSASTCSRCNAQDKLHHAVQRLNNVLDQDQRAQAPAQPARALPTHTSTAVWCAIGLAALAGSAVYAMRSPRIPEGVHPMDGFNLDRYLGKWYELARIEHSFEKGLQRTQAEYMARPDGSVQVINRGFDPKRGEWKVSHGRAKPLIAPDVAALKVSFFGPFYGGYNVVALDEDYQWAMVIGSSLEHFWILSRTPALPDGVEERLMRQAALIGVNTQQVLWVHQDGVNPTGSYK